MIPPPYQIMLQSVTKSQFSLFTILVLNW